MSLVLFISVIGFGFIACKKNKTCKVLIIVQDTLEAPLQHKVVRLWCDEVENTLCIIDDTARTLSDGTARFEFPNPAILKVYVNGAPEGYVELKAGEEVEKTITLP